MSEQVKSFIDKLSTGDNTEAGEAFKDALRAKVGDALEVRRQEMASNLFDTAAISDPKPEVIDPSPETVPAEMKTDAGEEGTEAEAPVEQPSAEAEAPVETDDAENK